MPIDTPEDLIDAVRTSGLIREDELDSVIDELERLGGDSNVLMRHLVEREWMSVYQLRKLIHGKGSELHIGPYILREKIGEGGMGKVYRARRGVDREELAIKIVRPILLSNPVIRKRYDREVAVAVQLKHENIVEVLDAGEVDGRHFLAMEFVDGIDLSRLVKEFRPLAIAEACEYIRQAALGLHYAHAAGFVHRDIKPSNVLVSGERHLPQAADPTVVKILDMGLIRAVGFDEDQPGDNDLTRAGTVVGTPDYMAPEQAKNSSAVDHRADLYSLGGTFYFLLTGRPPFPDGSPIEKILKHQLEAPLPLQALRPDVPTEVAEIVARLLAKSPDDRYPTARALAQELEPLARHEHWAGRQAETVESNQSSTGERSSPSTDSTRIGPSDGTPQPNSLPGPLHAAVDIYPLSALVEPPSDVLPPVLREKRSPAPKLTPVPPPPGNLWVMLLVVAAVGFAIVGFCIWLARR